MFVLALDTSSPAVTAAVAAIGDEISIAAVRTPLAARGHGELLTPSIADCLDDAGITPREVGAVVVGTGPGPFTGLRVGLVTAAAFADAIGVPAYGVCSLDAIGAACPEVDDLLVATDARRHEVYWARYRHGVRVGEPAVSAPADVPIGRGRGGRGRRRRALRRAVAVADPAAGALPGCARPGAAGRRPDRRRRTGATPRPALPAAPGRRRARRPQDRHGPGR